MGCCSKAKVTTMILNASVLQVYRKLPSCSSVLGKVLLAFLCSLCGVCAMRTHFSQSSARFWRQRQQKAAYTLHAAPGWPARAPVFKEFLGYGWPEGRRRLFVAAPVPLQSVKYTVRRGQQRITGVNGMVSRKQIQRNKSKCQFYAYGVQRKGFSE